MTIKGRHLVGKPVLSFCMCILSCVLCYPSMFALIDCDCVGIDSKEVSFPVGHLVLCTVGLHALAS